jgi:hypothetical protein
MFTVLTLAETKWTLSTSDMQDTLTELQDAGTLPVVG